MELLQSNSFAWEERSGQKRERERERKREGLLKTPDGKQYTHTGGRRLLLQAQGFVLLPRGSAPPFFLRERVKYAALSCGPVVRVVPVLYRSLWQSGTCSTCSFWTYISVKGTTSVRYISLKSLCLSRGRWVHYCFPPRTRDPQALIYQDTWL